MKKTFIVKGMHCPSCEMLIKDSLEEFDAVKSVSADFKEGNVNVDFDEKQIDEGKIKKIIANEGYVAK